jgi:hypothetical protein
LAPAQVPPEQLPPDLVTDAELEAAFGGPTGPAPEPYAPADLLERPQFVESDTGGSGAIISAQPLSIEDQMGREFAVPSPSITEQITGMPGDERAQAFDAIEDPEREAQLLRELDPYTYAMEADRREQAKVDAARAVYDAGKSEIEIDARERQAAIDARIVEADEKLAEIQAAAEAAPKEVDPSAWRKSLSWGEKLAGIAAAAIDGSLSVYRGGRNMAMERFEREADRHIQAQIQNIAAGRASRAEQMSVLGQVYRRTGDMQQAAAAEKQAQLLTLREAAMAKYQQFDPQGTQAMRIADSMRGIDQALAKGQAQAADDQYKRAKELAEFDLESRYKNAQIAKMQRETAKIGTGGGKGKGDKGTAGEAVVEISGDTLHGLQDAQGNAVPIKIKDRQAREDLKNKIRSTKSAHRMLTELQKIGGIRRAWKLGELSDADRKRAEQLAIGQILIEAKSMGGTITEGDIEFQGKRIPRDPQKLWQSMGSTRALLDGYYDDTLASLDQELETITGRSDLRLGLPAKPVPPTAKDEVEKATTPKVYDPATGASRDKTPEERGDEISRLPTTILEAVEAGEMSAEQGAAELRSAADKEGLDESVRAGLIAGAQVLETPGATVRGPGYGVEDLPEYRKETEAARQSTAQAVQQAREDRKDRPLFDDEVRGKLPGGGK